MTCLYCGKPAKAQMCRSCNLSRAARHNMAERKKRGKGPEQPWRVPAAMSPLPPEPDDDEAKARFVDAVMARYRR